MTVRRLRRGGPVSRANRLVSISDVLGWLGIAAPEVPVTSVKVMCPFVETHPADRQGEKDMRLYVDGHAFCHVCQEQYTTVKLISQAWDLSPIDAARAALARAGLDLTGNEDLESLLTAPSPERLRTGAVAALGWWADQHDIDRFGSEYARCLQLADQIKEPEHVDLWLIACKAHLLGDTHHA